MKITKWKKYRNLYSKVYSIVVTDNKKWTGYHARVDSSINPENEKLHHSKQYYMVTIGSPNRRTLKLIGYVKGLVKAKQMAERALKVEAKMTQQQEN